MRAAREAREARASPEWRNRARSGRPGAARLQERHPYLGDDRGVGDEDEDEVFGGEVLPEVPGGSRPDDDGQKALVGANSELFDMLRSGEGGREHGREAAVLCLYTADAGHVAGNSLPGIIGGQRLLVTALDRRADDRIGLP